MARDIKDAAGETASQAREAIREGLDTARERLGELAEGMQQRVRKVQEGATRASTVAKEKVDATMDQVRRGYTKVRKDLDGLAGDVNAYVRDNPGRSILIAAGLGFVVGLLVRGRRRDD